MKKEAIKLVAFDLDGTITQHKSTLEPQNKEVLDALASRYRLLIVGAGACVRIHSQLLHYPIDIIGNYGMQYATFDPLQGQLHLAENNSAPVDTATVLQRAQCLREQLDYIPYLGDTLEIHPSGMLTFPILGTGAPLAHKLAYDPDRVKRRRVYRQVVELFPEYKVFVGGSSSFDIVPRPYNKYYALDNYCRQNGFTHENVVYLGDDYGLGGNDEDVYRSDIAFIQVDDYKELAQHAKQLLY